MLVFFSIIYHVVLIQLSHQRIGVHAFSQAVLVYAPHGSPGSPALLTAPRDIGERDGDGVAAPGMLSPMLLQQERELVPALPRNLLIFFLVLSFFVLIFKYVYRLIKAQVEQLLAAANQDEEAELMEE
jgi:hypothetical protein